MVGDQSNLVVLRGHSSHLAEFDRSGSPLQGNGAREKRANIMSAHAHLVPTYLRLRKMGTALNHKLVQTLSKDVLDEGGRKLGILKKGTLVLGSEDELAVLMDYCIYNIYRGGRNAVEKMLEDSPPSNPDELTLLEAQTAAYYSIFQVVDVERGAGVMVEDTLRGG